MAIINDPTIITFTFRESQDQRVRAVLLGRMIQSIEELFDQTWGEYLTATAALFHVSTATPGSIKFHFVVDIEVSPDAKMPNNPALRRHKDVWQRIVDLSTIGAFLWAVLYAGDGMFRPSHTDNNSSSWREDEESLRQDLSYIFSSRSDLTSARFSLAEAARECNASSVTIQVVPNASITIYSEDAPVYISSHGAPMKSIRFSGFEGGKSFRILKKIPKYVEVKNVEYGAMVAQFDGAADTILVVLLIPKGISKRIVVGSGYSFPIYQVLVGEENTTNKCCIPGLSNFGSGASRPLLQGRVGELTAML